MAEILATWLNEEVGLTRKVDEFEEDFSSGYLFGELLWKFNQQANFEEFSKKDAISHRLQNFEKLEPTLRNLNIKFDSKMVDKIMKRERGIALRLLYQLKMVLEKVYPTTDIAVLTKTGQFGDNQPAQKIANSKEKYDRVQHQFFKQRINALNKPQKKLNMESHVKKFEEEKDRQSGMAKRCDQEDRQMAAMRKQEMRRIQINKLQRNAGFMEEWHQKGVEDWKKNQKRQRDREGKQLEFQLKQAQKYNSIAEDKLQTAKDEVSDGIDAFEQTLKSNGINPRVDKKQAEVAIDATLNGKGGSTAALRAGTLGGSLASSLNKNTMHGAPLTTATGAFTLESTGLKQRTKKTLTEATRKQREKRRRRLINQQEELMKELELKQRESMVVELIKHQSNQEKELDYEVWRTKQCKEVIAKNRQLRETQYERRRELDKSLAEQKEQEMLTTMQEATQRLVEERIVRSNEMSSYKAAAKTKNRSGLCSTLLDQIIDIADEAYNHQQKRDSQDIDQRNWHEWVQLFLNDMPITGTLDNLANLIPQESAGEGMEEKEALVDASNIKLDELELVDYLQNQGQWTADIVAKNKPKLEEILNPPAEVDPKAKGKAPAKGAQAEVNFDETELEVTDKAENNYLLGDALEEIIKINFEERASLHHPQTPNWLTVKLCLIGYPFAGKKQQADMIRKRFNLDVFVMEALVQEAIDFATENPNAIEVPSKEEKKEEDGDEKDELSDMAMSEDEQQEFNLMENFRQCGLKMQELLLDGEEISDELYVSVFVTKLRIQYPYKDPKTKQSEIKQQAHRQVDINDRLRAIQTELQKDDLKRKQIKVLESEQQALNDELYELQQTDPVGWVLVDFPASYAQAKLLEEALSGYKPTEEQNAIQRDIEMEDAFLLVQPTAKEQPPKMLTRSGLDAVVWFDCPLKECQRRADGRRIDCDELGKSAQTFFHVNDEKPPSDQAPLCERLEPMDEDWNHTSSLVDRVVSFDMQQTSLRTWLTSFGVEERQYNLLQEVNGNQSKDAVFDQISGVISSVLQNKQTERDAMREMFVIKLRKIQEEKDRQAAMDNVSDHNEKSVEDGEMNKTQGEMSQSISNRKEMTTEPGTAAGPGTGRQSKNADGKTIADSSVQEIAGKSGLSQNMSMQSINALPDRDNLDNDFKPVIIEIWRDLSRNYKHQMRRIFRNIRLQREQAGQKQSKLKTSFLEFLHTSDGKQAILDDFVKSFNSFSDEYPDLREDDQTKEEMHQRTDALSDELWEIVEERKEQAIEFRKKVMEYGFVEFNLEFLTQIAQQLMQAEVDKFKVQVQIVNDYYHAVEEKLIPEAPVVSTAEIAFPEGEEPPVVEQLPENSDSTKLESYSYPRLDRLLALAIKQQVVTDTTQVHAAADAKKGGAKGKDAKKGAPAAVEEQAAHKDSVYVEEMREAIRVEKSILRFRLVQVRNWALSQLRETRQTSLDLYKMLEDWIYVAQKAEMDAIEEMCVVIKDSIEEETKIQSELRINFMDFTVDQGVLNYITPPPPKHPPLEQKIGSRFTVPQIKNMIGEIQSMKKFQSMDGSDKMRLQPLYNFFKSRKNNTCGFQGDKTALPQSFLDMEMTQFMAMIRNLAADHNGHINYRQLLTYFILLCSSIPTTQQCAKMGEIADQSGLISRDAFLSATFWFEDSEGSKDLPQHEVFNRTRFIKEALFEANAKPAEGQEGNWVNAEELTKMLVLPAYKGAFKEFKDFLFAPVNKVEN